MSGSDYLEVHVDETGDRGMKPSSSPCFSMAALTFPASRRRDLFAGMRELNRLLGRPEGAALHAVDHLKDHGKMRVAMRHLVALDFARVFFVVVPKATVPPWSGIGKDPELLYNFTARLLLERASWLGSLVAAS